MFERSHNGPVITRSLLWAAALLTLVMILMLFSSNAKAEDTPTLAPKAAYGIDENENTYFEYLAIEESVHVSSTRFLNVTVEVYDGQGGLMANVHRQLYIAPYNESFTIKVPGSYMMGNVAPGDFSVTVTLYDMDDNMLAQDSYAVPGFEGNDFEAPAWFSASPTDWAVDTDANGQCEYLALEAHFGVVSSDYYHVSATLTDNEGNRINASSYYQYFASGTEGSTIVRFVGSDIITLATDGPYQVDLVLGDFDEIPIDEQTYTTSAYSRSLFQVAASLQGPFSEAPTDASGNGVYDYLIARCEMVVATPGTYRTGAFLSDLSGTNIDDDTTDWVYFEAGTTTLEFHFSGTLIANSGVNGPYTVFVALGDEYNNVLSTVSFPTSAYLATDFEQLVRFESYEVVMVDEDGDSLNEVLAVDTIIHFDYSDSLSLSATLTDSSGNWICSLSDWRSFSSSDNPYRFMMNGKDILSSGRVGPFYLSISVGTGDLRDDEVVTITGYDYDDFEPPAVLGDDITVSMVDEDGIGLYDSLLVEASVDVNYPSDSYWLIATLRDGSGKEVQTAYGSYSFTTGAQTMQVAFNGDIIADNGYDGNYQVDLDLTIYGATVIYVGAHTYLTDEIDSHQFQQEVRFEGPLYDAVYNNDGNDNFEMLVVGGTLNALIPGYYEVGGQWWSSSKEISYGSTSQVVFLEAGLNPVELYFSAINIMTDGPYSILLFVRQYDWPYSVLDTQEHWTSAYLGSDFERALIVSESDQGVDLNSNGAYEYLQLNIGLEVSVAGDYILEIDLTDSNYNSVVYEYIPIYLGTGLNTVTYNVPSPKIYNLGTVGEFNLNVKLRTTNYAWLDWDWFKTNSYKFSDFEHTTLQEPMTALGHDTNGNDKFEWLVVSCGVSSVDYNYYSLNAILKDKEGTIICERSASADLPPGESTMEVWISSMWVLQNGLDGPFTVEVTLLHEGSSIDDTSVIVTADYTLAQFEPPASISEPCSDQGVETNVNDLYEYLVVKVPIEVATPGNYFMYALMTVAPGVEIYPYGESYLYYDSPGLYEVELFFPGNTMYHLAEDGTYQVTIQLFDTNETYWLLDTVIFTTSSYMTSQFERVELSAPISDHGEDYGDDSEFDLLVVDIELYSTSETYVEIHAYLSDSGSNLITECWASIPVINGASSLRLEFDGLEIGCAQVNGPYTISMDVYTGMGGFLLQHTTQGYTANQFEQISFTANIAEEYPDGDGDGKYEYLFVGVEASSTLETDLYLSVTVSKFYDNGGYWYMTYMTPVHILVGTQTLGMKFPGSELMEEGPFNIEVSLYSEWGYNEMALVKASFDTPAYPADHFEPPVAIVSATDRLDEGDLLLEVEVEVSAPGQYMIEGYLYSSWSSIAYTSATEYLEAGMHTIFLRFPGAMIFASGRDGPYDAGIVVGGERPSLDYMWHTTGPYSHTDFSAPIKFTGQVWDYGVDIDGNGMFEYLRVEAEVEVATPGYYPLVVGLFDGNGNWIGSTDNSNFYFDMPGIYTMWVAYPASLILDWGSEGPYWVNLALVDETWSYLDGMEYLSNYYALSWFEWPARLIQPAIDHGMDKDEDGLFEYLALEITLEVTRSGWYVVQAYIYPQQYGMSFDSAYDWRYLEAGTRTIEILFPGQSITAAMIEGPIWYAIDLYWVLPDGSSQYMEWFPGMSANYYSWTMFEPGTALAPPHNDHLEDRDGDGLYDWLVVEVALHVAQEGKYTLDGELYANMFLDQITEDQASRDLKPGLQTVTLYFSGVEIWAKGLEGPYQVELRLLDRWGNQIEEGDHYVVSEFSPTDCERIEFQVGNKKGVLDLRSEYVEVIIFGSKMAKVHRIDPCSVRLGDGEEWARPCKWEFKDVNHDGRDDLVLKFKSKDLREVFGPGENVVVLGLKYQRVWVMMEQTVFVKIGRCDR